MLFFDPAQGSFYLQLSGRWFSAHGLVGAVGIRHRQVAAGFRAHPAGRPDAAVLASVPGTVQAQEAVLKAQIPTTATIQRSAAKLTVVYSGPPHFVPIPGTTMLSAVNTNVAGAADRRRVLCLRRRRVVRQPTPTGPWAAGRQRPAGDPHHSADQPVLRLTYVQVYAVTPDAVTYGYTAGYTLGYVSAGVLVYGTGYYYPPVVIAGPVPIFYPYPYTYAGAVWYNASTGAWARGGTMYGPYGGAVARDVLQSEHRRLGAWRRGLRAERRRRRVVGL